MSLSGIRSELSSALAVPSPSSLPGNVESKLVLIRAQVSCMGESVYFRSVCVADVFFSYAR